VSPLSHGSLSPLCLFESLFQVSSLAQGPLSSPALRNHAVVETLRRRLAFGFLPSSGPKSTSRASPTRQLKVENHHKSSEDNKFGSSNAGAASPSTGIDPASPTISPLSSPEASRPITEADISRPITEADISRPITEADIGSRRAAASAAIASDRIAKALSLKARASKKPGNDSHKEEQVAEDSTDMPASPDDAASKSDAWVLRPPLKVTPRRRPPAPPTRFASSDTAGSEAEVDPTPAEGPHGGGGGGGSVSVHAAARRPRTVKPRTSSAKITPEGKLAAAYSAKMMAIARSRRPVSPPTNLRSEAR